MTAPSRPRSRLPRRVYWVRRLVVLAVLTVVLGTGFRLVGALADSWRTAGEAELVTATGAEVIVSPGPTLLPTPSAQRSMSGERRSGTRETRQRLPQPDGACLDEDVVVEPRVAEAHVGQPIRIVLAVSTRSTPACTWEVTSDSVFLKVLRVGASQEVVWSSQQCPALMPTAEVVARQEQPAEVVVSWTGQMSDPGCTDQPAWVRAGRFQAVSLARGGVNPKEQEFELEEAVPEVVVVRPTPTADPSQGAREDPSEEASEDR